MQNKILKKVSKSLASHFTYFKHDNILVVSEDKTQLPFAYIVYDNRYPNTLLLSLSLDYFNIHSVSDVVIATSQIYEVNSSESFYISKDGTTHFSEDAYYYFDLENNKLKDLTPISNAIN